jgi:TPR repeat protein
MGNEAMKRWILCWAVLFWMLFALSVKADVEAGLQAYKKGDYSTALKELRPLAEHGDAQAQGVLGRMYDFGHGVPQDYKEAVKWYRLAADQGLATAQNHLGWMYRKPVPEPASSARIGLSASGSAGIIIERHYRKYQCACRYPGRHQNVSNQRTRPGGK